jgi:hypothetical protein
LWGWFGVDWWIWSLVVIAKVKNWNSIINDDGDFLTSDVEEHLVFLNILWILSGTAATAEAEERNQQSPRAPYLEASTETP